MFPRRHRGPTRPGGTVGFDGADRVSYGDPTDDYIGQTLPGQVRIVRRLDSGGAGSIYLGEAPPRAPGGRPEPLAIKILDVGDPVELNLGARKFQAEASITGLLRHPGIVKIYGHGRLYDGAPYLILELLEGEPLRARLSRGALGPEPTRHLLYAAADALAEAHGLGIVHRDLSPNNLFLARGPLGERLKVLDFGNARVRTQALEARPEDADADWGGTPDYMAPELAAAQPVDARADLYSLGAIAYECLIGRPPFVGAPTQVLLQHAKAPVPRLSSLGVALDPRFEAVIMQLLEKRPEDRPAHAGALREALAKLWTNPLSS